MIILSANYIVGLTVPLISPLEYRFTTRIASFPLDDLSTEEADELGPAQAVEVHLQIQGDQLIQLCASGGASLNICEEKTEAGRREDRGKDSTGSKRRNKRAFV